MTHQEYQRQYHQERKRWLKNHNMCVQCKKQDLHTLEGHCLCYECAEKANERQRKKMKGGE